MDTKKSNLDILDLTKLILSLFIVTMHLTPFPQSIMNYYLYPIFRTAVPLFFIISSFLFFKNINRKPQESRKIFKKFVLRNLNLYLFYLVVLAPATIYFKGYYKLSLSEFSITFIKQFIFGSTFLASWYIMALIIGISVVFWLNKKISPYIILGFGFLLNVICMFSSNYRAIAPNFILKLFDIYPDSMHLSFPVGIFYIEQNIILKNNLLFANDSYLTLTLLCPMIFAAIKDINIRLKYALLFRKFSTIAYCTHFSIGKTISLILSKLIGGEFTLNIIVLPLTLLICIFITLAVDSLEKKERLRLLKCSH